MQGVRLKVDRAQHIIDELNASVIAYLAENPYGTSGEFDREHSEYVWRGQVTKSPAYMSVIAGDAVHNLRSALDHLAWQLALLTTPTPFDRTQFPIALSPGEFNSQAGQKMIRDLSANHRALIETFQPYNRVEADDAPFAPWALRDLRILSNTDKHRLLNTAIARHARNLEIRNADITIAKDTSGYSNPRWITGGPVDGAELLRVTVEGAGPNPEMKMQGEIPVTVTFDDPALTGEQPGLVPLLGAVLKGVTEVVAAFESDL